MVNVLGVFRGQLENLIFGLGAGFKITIESVISTSNKFHGFDGALCARNGKQRNSNTLFPSMSNDLVFANHTPGPTTAKYLAIGIF